mmetsp:Transcript_34586/g.81532  ORF Transcript_34586/g.81532 Transcript_34586/m.81532 type:complete len:2271 (+) Transcript_34586:253-7065(+)
MMSSEDDNKSGDPSWKHPHAFHLNLPPNHIGSDGIPYITKFTHKKSRYILKLVESLVLTEEMFVSEEGEVIEMIVDGDGDADMKGIEAEDEKVNDLEEIEEVPIDAKPTNLCTFMRLCARLQSRMSSLENLKHSGLSRNDLSNIVLHILKLVTATYSIETIDGQKPSVTIYYEDVGYIHSPSDNISEEQQSSCIRQDPQSLERELQREFALPSPGRKVLMSLLVHILSNKGPLRSVSNAAVFPQINDAEQHNRFLLIIRWRVLLRMLLRTSPYLDEYKVGNHPTSSNLRENRIVRQTVQMIRDARHFFDQGLCPRAADTPMCDDKSACEIWEMVKTDVMFHSHTNACYRSLVMMYLFHPSRCTSEYYVKMMPIWFDAWTNIDRCPEIDFLWLTLFTRARKHLPASFDWGPIRRRLLTNSQYWLQVPIGGGTLDKSFPNAANPRSRSCPSRLKAFAGASSSYEEGIDFVAKVAKLLVIGLGSGKSIGGVSEGTKDVLRFLSFVTPYFNPSNLGSWTFTLGAFLHYFSYEVCCRMGVAGSMNSMKESHPELAKALTQVEPSLTVAHIPPHEVVALMDSLLPLCQQSLYSKNAHVGRAGEAAMVYLAQIDPFRVTPVFVDFAMRALGVSAVNLAHQAPAALSALMRLLQPSLRRDPNVLLVRLPELLRLTLAGIDSNDQNKTIRTLILYRSLTSWIPVGGAPNDWKYLTESNERELGERTDGTEVTGRNLHGHLCGLTESKSYIESVEKLPDTSLLKQGSYREDFDFDLLVREASSALSDWVLEFLDRIYDTLRATGEREKVASSATGVASRHSSADVQLARNFSRVLKECLIQTFASMDDEVHKLAVNSVKRFLSEETLPNAAKDTSFLCLAACSARIQNGHVVSPGIDALIPVLMDELEHHSNKTVVYRLRCLAGAVRSCGVAIIKHKNEIKKAINFALQSKDKHVYKTGCKLLRHTLSTLCESYCLAAGLVPRMAKQSGNIVFGKSAQLHNDSVEWHVPNGDCIQFASELLNQNIFERIQNIPQFNTEDTDSNINEIQSIDIPELRRCLRVLRYALRGGAGVVLDFDGVDSESLPDQMDTDCSEKINDEILFPYEQAMMNLLKASPKETYESMITMRCRLSSFIVTLMNLIASESFKVDTVSEGTGSAEGSKSTPDRKYLGSISSDPKVCKEATDIALLLLTRRGAAFRSQEGKNIWKTQKQLATDFAVLAEADHIAESLQRAQLYGSSNVVFFKDGEDAGKTLPRRLLLARVQLFHDSLQRTASFEIPRRLKRLSLLKKRRKKILFCKDVNTHHLCESMKNIKIADPPVALDVYEGIFDGLFSLTCHSNTQVRSSAIGVVDYAITRFGWLLRGRLPRLLSAIQLRDDNMHGRFGIPSCSMLKNAIDSQGKRKRLAEALKGVCSMLSIPRASKEILSTEEFRHDFISTICGNENLVSLMPTEEMQKMVHYLQSIFSPFRVGFYSVPRASNSEKKLHEDSLTFLISVFSTNEKDSESNEEEGDEKDAHWRKLLLACWFLTVIVDSDDLVKNEVIATKLWKLCFQILEDEYGQPLQRVALGLFGRLVMMVKNGPSFEILREEFLKESFCITFGKSLVYDHKEDSSVGGGHRAQWATGVADIIRDSARNIAPKSLFPFQRTNQNSGTFKISHAQLVEEILIGLGQVDAVTVARYLLSFSKKMAASPPSEDQRNQQCTSAEIFAGVTCALLQMMDGDALDEIWKSDLIPFLAESIPKFPMNLSGAYFDSIRFAIHSSPPDKFYPLTLWLFEKIEETLWQPKSEQTASDGNSGSDSKDAEDNEKNVSSQGTEGFTAQTKWLYLCCALLIELDETELDSTILRTRWYTKGLTKGFTDPNVTVKAEAVSTDSLKKSWKLVSERLLPRLIDALGHPYESCRDHISGCLFRICYCHRKMSIGTASNGPSRSNSAIDLSSLDKNDPGAVIVQKLLSLQNTTDKSFQNHYNSLITARRFFSYCVHFGEAKYEYSDYIIPLLPLAFEALKSTVEEGSENSEPDTVMKRALEAEVVKGYRRTIAEVSIASVISYSGSKGETDISRVLDTVEISAKHETWQVRHASAHFLRCFQGSHKFLFSEPQAEKIAKIVIGLLGDDRREVSSAAMAAVTGIIAAMPSDEVASLVQKYISEANRSKLKIKKTSKKVGADQTVQMSEAEEAEMKLKEQKRAKKQQSSVFFLCATVMSQPYETPPYIPKALAAISKHSFKRNAPLGIRDTVKKCCAEYKKTHMSDNWEVHRSVFSQEELEALEDVVSSPHYYA